MRVYIIKNYLILNELWTAGLPTNPQAMSLHTFSASYRIVITTDFLGGVWFLKDQEHINVSYKNKANINISPIQITQYLFPLVFACFINKMASGKWTVRRTVWSQSHITAPSGVAARNDATSNTGVSTEHHS